jgi:uncharacterized DUF497 family protein
VERGEEPQQLCQAWSGFQGRRTSVRRACVTFEDSRFDYGEERLITLGLLAGRALVIAHAPRGEATRIVSMRKANRREQEIYYQRLEES